MKTIINIEALETAAEEIRKVALKTTESYKLLLEAIEILKGEDDDTEDEARNEADAAVQAERKAVPAQRDGSLPHEGLPARVGRVREGQRRVPAVDDGADQEEAHPLEVKVVMPKQKRLKISKRDEQRVCEICGKAFTWGESGFKLSCSKECEKERLRRLSKRKREDTASIWGDNPPPRKKSRLDKKLKALEAEGISYADRQKAETIEKYARITIKAEDIGR